MLTIRIDKVLRDAFPENETGFRTVMQLQGTLYRAVKKRKTLRFEYQGEAYFAKLHQGIGIREWCKEILSGKTPVISARQEYDAIVHLQKQGILTPTVVGFGERGRLAWSRQSFLLTREIQGFTSLETVYRQPHTVALKRHCLLQLGQLLRRMHDSGLNHRDCYLCHFYLSDDHRQMLVMDLHRAQIRDRAPTRWRIKDISGLYFSAFPLAQREAYRFMRAYSGQSLRQCLAHPFWKKVQEKAQALYQKELRNPRG